MDRLSGQPFSQHGRRVGAALAGSRGGNALVVHDMRSGAACAVEGLPVHGDRRKVIVIPAGRQVTRAARRHSNQQFPEVDAACGYNPVADGCAGVGHVHVAISAFTGQPFSGCRQRDSAAHRALGVGVRCQGVCRCLTRGIERGAVHCHPREVRIRARCAQGARATHRLRGHEPAQADGVRRHGALGDNRHRCGARRARRCIGGQHGVGRRSDGRGDCLNARRGAREGEARVGAAPREGHRAAIGAGADERSAGGGGGQAAIAERVRSSAASVGDHRGDRRALARHDARGAYRGCKGVGGRGRVIGDRQRHIPSTQAEGVFLGSVRVEDVRIAVGGGGPGGIEPRALHRAAVLDKVVGAAGEPFVGGVHAVEIEAAAVDGEAVVAADDDLVIGRAR